jgi:TonB-dependent SusC/RagA subfamily outer membrane receptor
MKTFITLTLFLLAITGISFAQHVKLNKDTSAFSKSPLYIFKLYADDKEYNGIPLIGLIDQKDIASMEILKDKMANEQYGLKGKNGVIIITLSKDVEINQLDKLFDKYKIKQKQRTLPMYINNTLTHSTADMFYTASNKIKSVSIEKDTGMKYISIITTDYNPNPTPDNQFRIRGGNTPGM